MSCTPGSVPRTSLFLRAPRTVGPHQRGPVCLATAILRSKEVRGSDHLSGTCVTTRLVLPTNTWDCSGWGLPRPRIAAVPRALLPHDFTLAPASNCVAVGGSAVSFLLHSSAAKALVNRLHVSSVLSQSVTPLPRLATGRRYLPPVFRGVLSDGRIRLTLFS
ncbi:MAG: hypothetical protein G01um101438_69 [Parcubacteria group bacterium Gr01-1014_38]|nr:MAG: hypothetical protein G01um101438_69 [Parcubacteria group bacterium Gr01-1014_38]